VLFAVEWKRHQLTYFFALQFHFKGVVEGVELASNHVGNPSKFVHALFMLVKRGEA